MHFREVRFGAKRTFSEARKLAKRAALRKVRSAAQRCAALSSAGLRKCEI
jgi:hypothetical protein